MQINTIIEASADVIRITRLQAGDVYKRIVTSYQGDATLRIGVVQSVLQNGTDSAITAVEYSTQYPGVTAEVKVFTSDSTPALFPATPHEVETYLDDLVAAATKAVKEASDALSKREETKRLILDLAKDVALGAITEPETETGR